MRKSIISAAVAFFVGGQAFAASTFQLIVPLQSMGVVSSNIQVDLASQNLGDVSGAVSIDLRQYLTVTGDSPNVPGTVSWSATGLPRGLSITSSGVIQGIPVEAGSFEATATVHYKTKTKSAGYAMTTIPLAITITNTAFPIHYVNESVTLDVTSRVILSHNGGVGVDNLDITISGVPTGMTASGGQITGAPTVVGSNVIGVTAGYQGVSAQGQVPLAVHAKVKNFGTYRAWSDGSIATTCVEYRAGTQYKDYAGDTGDGIYRIKMGGVDHDVLCDMTRDGGGWILAMKQAQGDGVTLRGDSVYWTAGTQLNDTPANLPKSVNQNVVSKAFSSYVGAMYRLEATNETTMQYKNLPTAVTPQVAFSDANRVVATNYAQLKANGPSGVYPNWSVYATKYPDNTSVISTSSLSFNVLVYMNTSGLYTCGVRWGWISNQEGETVEPSHDACGMLGGYGPNYGSTWMGNNPSAWQPAAYLLWVK